MLTAHSDYNNEVSYSAKVFFTITKMTNRFVSLTVEYRKSVKSAKAHNDLYNIKLGMKMQNHLVEVMGQKKRHCVLRGAEEHTCGHQPCQGPHHTAPEFISGPSRQQYHHHCKPLHITYYYLLTNEKCSTHCIYINFSVKLSSN